MAFGDSFGSILDRTKQVEGKREWPIGKLGETVFETSDSPVAVSILYIFDVSYHLFILVFVLTHRHFL